MRFASLAACVLAICASFGTVNAIQANAADLEKLAGNERILSYEDVMKLGYEEDQDLRHEDHDEFSDGNDADDDDDEDDDDFDQDSAL
eukprot:NODE_29838_length_434_cov_4.335505.p2 GENE.NODE_29838_length_434_cov_4.335505~~NODE_29838_length_434_cov_4.335505.p2  ORF type:complete len:88 (-),score=30.30 NODE_29838_length_434_cov_4.335505:65-328(-)